MNLTNCISASPRRRIGLALLAVVVAAALLVAWDTARAFEAQPPHGAPSESVAPQESDSDPEANLPYLFAVFILTWLAFFGYVFFMSRRQREMQREIDELKRALDERDA